MSQAHLQPDRRLFAVSFVADEQFPAFFALDARVLGGLGHEHVFVVFEVEVDLEVPALAGEGVFVVEGEQQQVRGFRADVEEVVEEPAQLRGVADVEGELGVQREVLFVELDQVLLVEHDRLDVAPVAALLGLGFAEDLERVVREVVGRLDLEEAVADRGDVLVTRGHLERVDQQRGKGAHVFDGEARVRVVVVALFFGLVSGPYREGGLDDVFVLEEVRVAQAEVERDLQRAAERDEHDEQVPVRDAAWVTRGDLRSRA